MQAQERRCFVLDSPPALSEIDEEKLVKCGYMYCDCHFSNKPNPLYMYIKQFICTSNMISLFISLCIGLIFVAVAIYSIYIKYRIQCASTMSDTASKTSTFSSLRHRFFQVRSNRLSFKRSVPPDPTELPRRLSHRKLFRRSEVRRFIDHRKPSIHAEDGIDGHQLGANMSRRKSSFPHVPRHITEERPSTREHYPLARSYSADSRRFYLPTPVLNPVIEITEADSVESNDTCLPVNPGLLSARRMSRRKSSVFVGNRRQSRRMSVLRNVPLDIPGIPSKDKEDVIPTRKPSLKRKSSFGKAHSLSHQRGRGLRGALAEFKHVFGPQAHDILLMRHTEYGPVYQFSALGQKIVFLFDFNDIDSLKKAEGRFPRHIDFKHLRLYREKKEYPQGLLISHGEEWKKQRRLLAKMMCSSMALSNYTPAINEVAKKMTSFIDALISQEDSDGTMIPESCTGRYAIESFGRVLYGHSMNCINNNPNNDMVTFVEMARQNLEDAKKLLVVPTLLLPLHPAWKRHNEHWNFLLKTTMNTIERYQNSKGFLNRCMLQEVMASEEMNDGELFINFTDLTLASIDTTSTLIQWCLYELGINPCIQGEVYNEIQSASTKSAGPLEMIQKLVLLRAVIKETLRLHPVGFMTSRIIERDMILREHNIPVKTHVAISMYVMGRDPKMFPDPEKFDPGRWMTSNKTLDKFYNDVPFGFGPRMCIGRRIAEVEVLLFLMHFCGRFHFTVLDHPIRHRVQLLLCPETPLRLKLQSRDKIM